MYIHSTVLHALGFKHEHARFDRDNFLTYIAENDATKSSFAKQPMENFIRAPANWGGDFDIESVLIYKSGTGGKYVKGEEQPVTVVKNTGEKHAQGVRITTMDALQAAYRYCKPRGFDRKETVNCPTLDPTGVTRLVFKVKFI